jgi:hypothetical protein
VQDEKLIYIDDYEITDNNLCVIKFESIDENALKSVENEEFLSVDSLEISMELVSPEELESWNNSFVYFEKFDLAQNGFANAQKGGNKTNARKINNIVRKLMEDLSVFVKSSIQEPNKNKIKNNEKWFYCVFNVGRGESNLVITPSGKLYLFDGGDSTQSVGSKISNVVNYINLTYKLSICDKISGLFISHPDNDHFRGVIDVIDSHLLSNDCFIYYNYHGYYPKANWATALKKIQKSLASKKLSYVVHIPEQKYLSNLSGLLPSLYLTTTWPYDVRKKISKINGYNANESSHCFYIGRNISSLSFNLFGDIEKKGWEKNGDLPYLKLNNHFIFKPSHHGRKSGDPIVSFSGPSSVNLHVDSNLSKASIKAKYVSSANTNVGKVYSTLAAKATLSTSSSNALIYVFSANGKVTTVKT